MSVPFYLPQICSKTLRPLVILLFATLMSGPAAFAQRRDTSARRLPPAPVVQKRFGRAATELGIAELTPFVFDRYVAKKDYAKITWGTTAYNLNPGHWAWDNDPFQENQFGHPYHGSQFYSAFRANGFTFWQSVPAAFAGSYLWETFAETQAPAPNDFINTSFGGIVLGEMTYRLANKIINDRSRGFKRQVSEVAGLLISPMNGLNRILDGRWGKVTRNPRERDSSSISVSFDAGLRKIYASNSYGGGNRRFGPYTHISLLYGTPYENYRHPFTNIVINTEFGQDDSTLLNMISVYGSLAGWEIRSSRSLKHLAILSANYDFIHNAAFFYGGQSVKMNLFSRFIVSKNIRLNTTLAAGPILLAAIPDPYVTNGRDYDYGSGGAFSAGGTLNFFNRLSAGVNYTGGWTKTLNGTNSNYYVQTITSEFSYKLKGNFALNAEPGYYTLDGHYANHPNTNRKYPYIRFALRYNLNNQDARRAINNQSVIE